MIVSYRDKKTRRFAEGDSVAAFEKFRRQIEKRLAVFEAATGLDDLRALPSTRLEVLRGDRAGQWSIRVNMQWRLCFSWSAGAPGPSNVELIDYH